MDTIREGFLFLIGAGAAVVFIAACVTLILAALIYILSNLYG